MPNREPDPRDQRDPRDPREEMSEMLMPAPGRMYRTMSGFSLADHEVLLNNTGRRGSEQVGQAGGVGGKKNFRSKRFSRNIDREPALKRAQSFHMDQRDDSDLWHDSQRRPFHRLDIVIDYLEI